MTYPCRILFIAHMENVEAMQNILQKAEVQYSADVLSTISDLKNALDKSQPDIMIADKSLHERIQDLYTLKKRHWPTASFILLTEKLSETEKRDLAEQKIDDYLLESDLDRLPVTITNAMSRQALATCSMELETLYENYEKSREAEKLRIAQELHDELGQVLTALKIDLSLLGKQLISLVDQNNKSQLIDDLNQILHTVDSSMSTVRKIASGLRPDILDKLGLLDAIEWLADETVRKRGIKCRTDLPDELELPEVHNIAVFRIIQEALTNVIRHADASEVIIRCKEDNQTLFLVVIDNGKGISKSDMMKSTSLGLIGLKERVRSLNGRFEIASKEQGTLVSVEIPIDTHLMNEKV